MDYSAILFDLDGTLIDSLPGIEYAFDHSLALLDLPSRKESLKSFIGPPIRSIFSQIVERATEAQLNGLERAFRECYDRDGWRRTLLHQNAIETLRSLRQAGVPLYVVTNKPSLPTRQILRELNLEQFFTALVSRDSKNPPYFSKGEMLRAVCAQYSLDPKTCLYVGDTLEDYHAGREAGVPVAIVPHGYGSLDAQQFPASCRALNNLADLLETIESLEIS